MSASGWSAKLMHRPRLLAFLLAVGGTVALACWLYQRELSLTPPPETEEHSRIRKSVPHNVSAEVVNEVLRLEAQEKHISETVWAKEMLAQECGRTIEKLWDSINAASNKLEVLAQFPIGQIQLGNWKNPEEYPHGIRLYRSSTPGPLLSSNEWPDFVARFQSAGWTLEQIEFRHNGFDSDSALEPQIKPSHSRFYFSAHLLNTTRNDRATLEGVLDLAWGPKRDDLSYEITKANATHLTLKTRHGDPPFKLVLDDEIVPQGQSKYIDPLILYDPDGDGLSEIILAARNLVYRNRGKFQFTPEPLCRFPEQFISTALTADFDGDGTAGFLCKKWEGLFLFKGSKEGRFEEKSRLVWKPQKPLQKPMVMTCGDIDGDGDLDLFIAQYKEPYDGGATPQPFHDANDGEPAYLLLNEGKGKFGDGTETSGLAHKQRRTYSASFADLDQDADLDLIVVSDFAGLDLYRNDGKGRFTDVTRQWIQPPAAAKAFGMAHALSDFNNDGLLDLFMTGMTSATAERLDHLGLSRSESETDKTMRREMTHGNRLYLGAKSNQFRESASSMMIARSGWSWGCSAFDFDNDGWEDLYVANGLESNKSVADYESEYWLHDRFVGATNAGSAADLYFQAKFSRTRMRTDSYGGYEKNRFYLNRRGESFVEIAYLFGIALEQDCRSVVADDLDGDGDGDLIVTTLEIWPKPRQALYIFENQTRNSGNWIGFRFRPSQNKPIYGTTVLVQTDSGSTVRQLVTGDSYRSQHSGTIHFGLGKGTAVKAEIHWVNGKITSMYRPLANRYHLME